MLVLPAGIGLRVAWRARSSKAGLTYAYGRAPGFPGSSPGVYHGRVGVSSSSIAEESEPGALLEGKRGVSSGARRCCAAASPAGLDAVASGVTGAAVSGAAVTGVAVAGAAVSGAPIVGPDGAGLWSRWATDWA